MPDFVVQNRGTDEHPFGFVYRVEGGEAVARAYFALVDEGRDTFGAGRIRELRIGGPGSDYWASFSRAELSLAQHELLTLFGLVPA